MTEQIGHSSIGGSVAHRFINCSAAPKRSEGLEETNEAAEKGTFVHFVGQQILTHGIKKVTPTSVVNYELVYHAVNGQPSTNLYSGEAEKIAENVQLYVDTVRSQVTNPTDTFEVEHKVRLDWLHKDLRGTVDSRVHKPSQKTLMVTDYKNGYVTVEVEDNIQLKYYALGEIGENNPTGIERVFLCIVQPNANHPKGPVRYWETTAAALALWGLDTLGPAAHATDDPNAPTKAGPWCKYCPASTKTCQAITNLALSLPVVTGEVMNEDLTKKALAFDELYGPWIKKIRTGAVEMLKKGIKVPGSKLVRSITKRKWTDEGAALKRLKFGYGRGVLKPPIEELKSFTKLEKELPPGALRDLLEKPEGVLILVPESDSRKEVVVAPGSVFDTVPASRKELITRMTVDYTKKKVGPS